MPLCGNPPKVDYSIGQNKMAENKNNLIPRPPVVVVLGHVDHGKTSLLDKIRQAKVADSESGGITQHVGAYQTEFKGKTITFIDTPGHEAFSAIRSRGAKVADIAILVVAVDDGIQQQTKEAIEIIKKAGIPVIVAINKIDRPDAQQEKIKRDLMEFDLVPESMGGKVPTIGVSAKTGQGIDELLEMILLIAEMENLIADILKPVDGTVIESYMDKQKGPVATVLIRNGEIKAGDLIGTQSTYGKIKTLENFKLQPIGKALPSMPVVVLGFQSVPGVGEIVQPFANEEEAKSYIANKKEKEKSANVIFVESDKKAFNLIVKADVKGSLEAIESVIQGLPQDKVVFRILKAEVGDITENDVKTGESAKAIIFGFRVKQSSTVSELSERLKVKIFTFDIIYDLIQSVRNFAEKTLAPEIVKTTAGKLKILAIFIQEKGKQIVGGKVIDGEIINKLKLDIERNKAIVGSGRIMQLQKNKIEANKVLKGQECGIMFEGDVKLEAGDVLIAFTEERQKTLL